MFIESFLFAAGVVAAAVFSGRIIADETEFCRQ
jgi:hypothetical protein